jgi:hypothetical protein
MSIDDATLLQVNATVIVGVFILLTLRQLAHIKGGNVGPDTATTTNIPIWGRLTFALVLPFAISAFFILIEDAWPTILTFDTASKIFAIVGFVYIIILFFYFFVYKKVI